MIRKEQDTFGLTYHEELFSKLSVKRAYEIILNPDTVVYNENKGDLYIAENYFGSFVYVTMKHKDGTLLQIFGIGYHDTAEQFKDEFTINFGIDEQYYEKYPLVENKQKFVDALECHRKDEKSYYSDHEQSDTGYLFSVLAELGDEDGAYAELEDAGLL